MQSDGYSLTSNLSEISHDQGLCMLIAQSSFETLKAVAYLKKFCRHFAYKLATEFDDSHGRVDSLAVDIVRINDATHLEVAKCRANRYHSRI